MSADQKPQRNALGDDPLNPEYTLNDALSFIEEKISDEYCEYSETLPNEEAWLTIKDDLCSLVWKVRKLARDGDRYKEALRKIESGEHEPYGKECWKNCNDDPCRCEPRIARDALSENQSAPPIL